jgi:anti-sigma factor RsiW
MNTCGQVNKRLPDLASRPSAQLPAAIQQHLAACPSCDRAVAATRMLQGLLAGAAEPPEPPTQFVDRLLEALPVRHLPAAVSVDPWRSAWGLVPAFAAMVIGLFLLYQANQAPTLPGVLPVDELPMSEQLVLGTVASQPDLVLAAVLEGDAP